MFHVEHSSTPLRYRQGLDGQIGRTIDILLFGLVMQTEKHNDAEDNGQENLSDMIVENLLVGVGWVKALGLFYAGYFDGIDCGRCFFLVHVRCSLRQDTRFPEGLAHLSSWGSSLDF
jgi:hypothetical protein